MDDVVVRMADEVVFLARDLVCDEVQGAPWTDPEVIRAHVVTVLEEAQERVRKIPLDEFEI